MPQKKGQLLFCRKYPLEKGVTFLMWMDILGMILYAGNIAGIIIGFSNGSQTDYYLEVVYLSGTFVTGMNTIILLYSSLIIALVSIPRLFACLFVKEEPLEYHRRHGYYLVRATTCGLLIVIQAIAFTALVYFLVKCLTDPSYSESTLLNERILPLLIAYGLALFASIALDAYWTVQALYFHKEGKKKSSQLLNRKPVEITSNNTSMITEVPLPVQQAPKHHHHAHTNSMTALNAPVVIDELPIQTIFQAGESHNGQRTGITTPNKTDEGWQQVVEGHKDDKTKKDSTHDGPLPPNSEMVTDRKQEKQSWDMSARTNNNQPVPEGSQKKTESVSMDKAPLPPSPPEVPPTSIEDKKPEKKKTEDEEMDILLEKAIDEIWKKHDKDKNGYLNRREAREFVKTTLSEIVEGQKYSEDNFQRLFTEFDKNKSGNISKRELKLFLKKLVS